MITTNLLQFLYRLQTKLQIVVMFLPKEICMGEDRGVGIKLMYRVNWTDCNELLCKHMSM